MDATSFGFPFRINELGRVAALTGADNIRAKVLQTLMTSPGERVMLPEFGCGLRDLLFDPNNEVLAAATEFTVTKSLQRWLGDEILVQRVEVENIDGELQIEVIYIRRDRLTAGQVKIAF
ncbi:MAG TPA: GPW/gp25 family protein [Blastocatellia bacterium]|jgi:phage baseplate assembly protein W|nr:GPW/gp25 family protein [Blastocatellia bacterium]